MKTLYHQTNVGAGKVVGTHRLVWTAAYGPIPPGRLIHHIDQDKYNNALDNLLCLTYSEAKHQLVLTAPEKALAGCLTVVSQLVIILVILNLWGTSVAIVWLAVGPRLTWH
jgi:hypothetical protein